MHLIIVSCCVPQYLEKTKQLRMLRTVNKNDTVTAIPTVGYRHVGFQVTLFDESCGEVKEPIIQYPKPDMPFSDWSHMAWNNSALGNFNLGYGKIEEYELSMMNIDLSSFLLQPNAHFIDVNRSRRLSRAS